MIPQNMNGTRKKKPEIIVITTHKGHTYQKIVFPLLNKMKFNGEIITTATYGLSECGN